MNITVEEFCRKKGVIRKWKKNTLDDNTKGRMLNLFESKTERSAFRGAFDWGNTPEGVNFWASLNDEFNKINKEK